jgi:hypothetical protein
MLSQSHWLTEGSVRLHESPEFSTIHTFTVTVITAAKRAATNSLWRLSVSDSFRSVKSFNTPLAGGASAMGIGCVDHDLARRVGRGDRTQGFCRYCAFHRQNDYFRELGREFVGRVPKTENRSNAYLLAVRVE